MKILCVEKTNDRESLAGDSCHNTAGSSSLAALTAETLWSQPHLVVPRFAILRWWKLIWGVGIQSDCAVSL